MTIATAPLATSRCDSASDGRVARAVEFAAVGGATVVLFPLAWLLRRAVGAEASELAVGFATFYGAYLINDPHFAVTYLLFYKDVRARAFGAELGTAQRLRYVTAGFVVPAALLVWAGGALAFGSAQALGWMVQLMLLLVGWHYVKQGFGVLAVLSARRGSPVSGRERRVILFHCYAAWAYAWASPALPAGEYEEKGVVYRALQHPHWLEVLTGAILGVSVVLLLWLFATARRRERRALPLAPLSAFLITVWSWSIYSAIDPLIQYVIPALHSVQYLYFVWLMKRNQAHAAERAEPFGPPARSRLAVLALSALGLGFLLFHAAPGILDAALVPRSRGRALNENLGLTPFAAAFFVVVNVHHYFMDNVIWRRENTDTRFLTMDPERSTR